MRIDTDVGVRADADADPALADGECGGEAVAQVGLGRRADADPASAFGEQIELMPVRVCGMDDGGERAQAPGLVQQLDRPHPMLGHALLDLTRLLVGVNVQNELTLARVAADRLEPLTGTRADRVGGNADAHALGLERLYLL